MLTKEHFSSQQWPSTVFSLCYSTTSYFTSTKSTTVISVAVVNSNLSNCTPTKKTQVYLNSKSLRKAPTLSNSTSPPSSVSSSNKAKTKNYSRSADPLSYSSNIKKRRTLNKKISLHSSMES